ncbi:MAG: hypothetical protein IIA45_01250 [Bacteroidetes bacterium]|nr:hypothetical protein [Bacteroidota bacterium]
MKNLIILLLGTVILFGFDSTTIIPQKVHTINPIIGDISFISKFGYAPNSTTDETLRISTHLSYVEELLRQKDISHLTVEQKENRQFLIGALHEYWTTMPFPRNYDHPEERKPCFIDKDGIICAVGYLVEETAGIAFAEDINSRFKYAEIYEMDNNELAVWVENSGLALEEVAMIQPTYGWSNTVATPDITPAYAATSAALWGINLATSTLNLINLSNINNPKFLSTLGFISGSASVTIGIINLEQGSYWAGFNTGKTTLNMINIGSGVATIFFSSYALYKNERSTPPLANWSIYSIPTSTTGSAVGIGLTRSF